MFTTIIRNIVCAKHFIKLLRLGTAVKIIYCRPVCVISAKLPRHLAALLMHLKTLNVEKGCTIYHLYECKRVSFYLKLQTHGFFH